MTYAPTTWVDYTTPCIDAARLNQIEHGVDIAQGDVMVLRGVTAAIPASDPELVGRLYIETDLLLRTWRDNGAGWDLAITPGAGGGGAWNLVSETILGAPAANITFAAIPGTYRCLVFLIRARSDNAAEYVDLNCRANADGGNNYDYLNALLYESAISGQADRAAALIRLWRIEAALARANTFSGGILYWEDYALADREKRCFGKGDGMRDLSADSELTIIEVLGQWRNVAAITEIMLWPSAGNFITGSRFTLYGIT